MNDGKRTGGIGSGAAPVVAALACAWLAACQGLAKVWATHPQYAYGWSTPLLAAYFLWGRRKDRPVPEPARGLFFPLSALAALAGVPVLRVLSEANPDWRLPYAVMMLLAVCATFCGLAFFGGWPWVRHFAFPVLFPLCALPWPAAMERDVAHGLASFNAGVAEETLSWMGMEVVRSGNVLRTPSGTIGVDEACGGIRGLQASMMLALCFGELRRAGVRGRAALLLAGPPVALGVNLLRSLALAAVAASSGARGFEAAHGVAAYAAWALQIGAMYGLARLFPPAPRGAPIPPQPFAARRGGVLLPAAAIVLLAAGEIALRSWFSAGRMAASRAPAWSLSKTTDAPWSPVTLPRSTLEALGSDRHLAFAGSDPAGRPWVLYGIVWKPGNLMAIPARVHSPEVCLTGRAGMRLAERPRAVSADVSGMALEFSLFRFEGEGKRWTVLFGGFEPGVSARGTGVRMLTAAERVRRAMARGSSPGYVSLEFCVAGEIGEAEFLAAAESALSGIVRPGG